MTLPNLIGISGKAGVGKDTLADYLVGEYGFVRYGFADPIKRLLEELFDWRPRDWDDRIWKEGPVIGYITREKGLNDFKSPRQLAQWLGTEVGRKTFGQDCWVDVFERWYRGRWQQMDIRGKMNKGFVVIPDVRFENEALRIRELGGTIIHLTRPGVTPVSAHESEAGIALLPQDIRIDNYGTIEDLHATFNSVFF